jgi:metal-responsive CopG/Arc/MetJ family transcriptional regulator
MPARPPHSAKPPHEEDRCVTFRISLKELKHLDSVANERGISRSDVIRAALRSEPKGGTKRSA